MHLVCMSLVVLSTAAENEQLRSALVERDAKKVAQLQSSMDVLAVAGDGCDPEILKTHAKLFVDKSK